MGLAGGLATNGQAGGGGGTGSTAVAFGTLAARPAAAAGNSGTAYYATDTGEITFSNGSAWNAIQNTSNTTFSVGNPSGATYTQLGPSGPAGSSQALYLRGPNSALAYASNFALEYPGNLGVSGVGNGLRVAEGSNAKQGTATLTAGSVVVANTSVTSTSRIFLTSQADGGTPGFLRVSTRTAGTSFTVVSSSGTDTSTFAYEIFETG